MTRYSQRMSQVQNLPRLSPQQKKRLRRIAIGAFRDRTGTKTYLALRRELPRAPFRTTTDSINLVSRALTPKR